MCFKQGKMFKARLEHGLREDEEKVTLLELFFAFEKSLPS